MKKFAFLFIHDNVVKTGRTFYLNKSVIGLLCAFCLVSLLAFIVFLYGFSQYAYNRAAFTYELMARQNLCGELDFIHKMAMENESTIRRLFRFDDNIRILYGIKSVPKDIREVGIGGPDFTPDENTKPLTHLNREQEIEELKIRLEKLLRQAEFEKSSLTEINLGIVMVKKRLRRFPAVLPAFGRLSSAYGHRTDPITGLPTYHHGVDIANRIWTPIYASADGVVKLMEFNNDGFGNLVLIDHGFGFQTLYGHLQDFMTKKDQFVMRGDLIGYIGESGRTTGPHLHYEIRHYSRAVDPLECVHPMTLGLE